MTLSGGLRYDHVWSHFPRQQLGPNPFFPTAVVYEPSDGVSYNDITPRFGAAYDLFGNGKTAIKVNAGKYLVAADGSSITGGLLNPLSRVSTSANRTWTDENRNFRPDCDLRNSQAQDLRPSGGDFCGLSSNLNFGLPVFNITYDPDSIAGWGKRGYDWNFGVQVQQELLPRVSVNVGYFRRIFGNFFVTDNLATRATDYDTFSIIAPADPRLPDGGGYTVSNLVDVKPALAGVTNNFQTFSDVYGKQRRHWNGVEVNFTARVRGGLTFQGGTSTGRRIDDNCEIRAAVPEIALGAQNSINPYCLPGAAVPDRLEGARLVHDPEDRRAGQRHAPEHSRGPAERQLPGVVGDGRVVARPAALGQRPVRPRSIWSSPERSLAIASTSSTSALARFCGSATCAPRSRWTCTMR